MSAPSAVSENFNTDDKVNMFWSLIKSLAK